MKYLLDTHLLMWTALDAPQLPKKARTLITDPMNELWFSVASIWEISIKVAKSLHRDFDVDVVELRRGLLSHGFGELSILSPHAMGVALLPHHHGDPFDRLLVSQAVNERMELLTCDRKLAKYQYTRFVR